jgi:hypothetical protein
LVFGFAFAGSVNAMVPAEKHLNFARENLAIHLLNEVCPSKALLITISEESKRWDAECNKIQPEESMTDEELKIRKCDCLNPLRNVLKGDVSQIIDTPLDAEKTHMIHKLVAEIRYNLRKRTERIEAEQSTRRKRNRRPAVRAVAIHSSK